ncbi:ribonuclease T2 family protein [Manganibacter manganicus]|uniref:Uncharacterized protein n=1 Tax=Manganibacter manganicus TaxID=1873176 RepID=A0A1V8RWC2_9HYPH|nr:hypothetical protein [Pseudaminobacter manganicus]OQM77329.1 hypothetical protein BFN67_00295 [Pseudaminobacter manganicus]
MRSVLALAVACLALSPIGQTKAAMAASAKSGYVLALNWQPAFCETRPRKPECRSQTANRYDATHFTLHGLWPQPNDKFYCNVGRGDRRDDKSGRWWKLPRVRLDPKVRAELDRVMPGTASQLERHEWIKHGTCSGKSQQDYFSAALAMAGAVNASAVRVLFASHIGKELTAEQIRAAFDKAFGAGAGERVRISCFRDRGKRMIGGVTLGLAGPIGPDVPLRDLMAASAPTRHAGCPRGIVDAAGIQ